MNKCQKMLKRIKTRKIMQFPTEPTTNHVPEFPAVDPASPNQYSTCIESKCGSNKLKVTMAASMVSMLFGIIYLVISQSK